MYLFCSDVLSLILKYHSVYTEAEWSVNDNMQVPSQPELPRHHAQIIPVHD